MANDPVAERLGHIDTRLKELRQKLDDSVTSHDTQLKRLKSGLDGLSTSIAKDDNHQQAVQKSLTELGEAVAGSSKRLAELHVTLGGVQTELGLFIAETRSTRAAEAELAEATERLAREYGHYDAVRRNARGILDARAAGIVTGETLEQAAARLMLDAPGYWLPPALAAIAGWSGRQEGAPPTAREAIRRAPGKAALFFGLIAARAADHDAAAHWIEQYLLSLDCRALDASFATVMSAVGRGDLGAPARDRFTVTCAGWRNLLLNDGALARGQVERWRAFIASLPPPPRVDGHFEVLRSDPRLTEKVGLLGACTVFHPLRERLERQLRCADANAENAQASIDGLLGYLVEAPDEREASLRDLVAERRAALRNPGRRAGRTASPGGSPANPAGRDLLTLLTDAALGTLGASLPAAEPPLALRLSADLIRQAIARLRRDYARAMPPSVDIVIEGWRRPVRQDDDADFLVLEFVKFARSEATRASDRRFLRRRDDVMAEWRIREQDGSELIKRAVPAVHSFFAEWHKSMRAADECTGLLDGAGSP